MNSVRIAVMSDVHGNLPALEAVLKDIEKRQCDSIYHLGDAIALGPFPQECLEKMLAIGNMKMLMGNHEQYFVFGISPEKLSHMGRDEILHQRWTHQIIHPSLKDIVGNFPYRIQESFFDTEVCFLHYPLGENTTCFKKIVDRPNYNELEELFQEKDCKVVFYGHHHPAYVVKGNRHFINPGSLGCSKEARARYVIAEFTEEGYHTRHISVPYDKEILFQALEERNIPGRDFVAEVFFGRKYE